MDIKNKDDEGQERNKETWKITLRGKQDNFLRAIGANCTSCSIEHIE
jgi:hypothetical protein